MSGNGEAAPGPHFGLVAIVGRPNVGKSTLMNHLLGQKVSITSRKPQTTRNRILGIDTDGDYQCVYVDTPGLHREERRALNRLMNRAAESALCDIDLVLFVVDATQWTDEDELVLAKVARARAEVVLVLNKVDKIRDKSELLPILQRLGEKVSFRELVPVSALKGDNLDAIRKLVRDHLPPGEHCFDDEAVTDRPVRFMAAEIIREKLMRQMGDELPYSAVVEIDGFSEEEGLTRIHAKILVERQGQKKMVVGHGGARIKMIGSEARIDLERLLGTRVYLELFVKVKAGWADDERALKSLGLSDFGD
ncbi:MAG: GTPase Era [Succinivibrionaceae bacterium]|nr:GTPase Era [Succinivibrionaceae bacterium]